MAEEIRFTYSGYAYTPVMGERPTYRIGFERGGRLDWMEVRAWDAIEAQVAAKQLGVPWVAM